MASAIRSSFESYLSSNTHLVKATSDSHFIKVLRRPECHYKIVKAADTILDAIEEIARASQASEETFIGLAYGRTSAKMVRDILGVVHIFTGLIPRLIFALKLICDLCQGLVTHTDVPLHPSKESSELDYNEIAKGNSEKVLSLVSTSAQFIKAGSATFAFASPFVSLAAQPIALLVKHSSGFIGHAFEMGYHSVAFQRALEEGEPSVYAYQIFAKKWIELSVGLLEKGLQLIHDGAKMLHATTPASVRLPLAFAIAGLGFYKVWLKTE